MRGSGKPEARELATRARVHESTARRWLRTGRQPWWLECARDLGAFGEAWRGWSLQGDTLRSPEGEHFTPSDLRALRVMRGQIEVYQQMLKFQLQADWVDGRYVKVAVDDETPAPTRRPSPPDPTVLAARRLLPPNPATVVGRRRVARVGS